MKTEKTTKQTQNKTKTKQPKLKKQMKVYNLKQQANRNVQLKEKNTWINLIKPQKCQKQQRKKVQQQQVVVVG